MGRDAEIDGGGGSEGFHEGRRRRGCSVLRRADRAKDFARITGHHGRSHAVHDAGVAKANGHDDGASARTSGADAERFQSKTRRKVTSHTQLTNTTKVVP